MYRAEQIIMYYQQLFTYDFKKKQQQRNAVKKKPMHKAVKFCKFQRLLNCRRLLQP